MTTIEAVNLANTPVLAAIAWAYLAINATRIFTYVPQIIAVWRCTDGARAISLLTWGSWAVSHLSGLAYGALVLHDRFFVVITTINLLGCTSVTSIAAMHRWRLHHPPDTTAPRTPPPAKPATSASHLLRVTAKPPAFRWVGAAQLLLAACAGALVTVLWLPPRLPPGTATAMATPHLTARNTIDDLRADASMGRPYAAADLIDTLLARYETRGDQEALFEAMLLLDQHWDQQQVLSSGVLQRVVQKHCPAERLLRRFWICDTGE